MKQIYQLNRKDDDSGRFPRQVEGEAQVSRGTVYWIIAKDIQWIECSNLYSVQLNHLGSGFYFGHFPL